MNNKEISEKKISTHMKSSIDWDKLFKEQGEEEGSRVFNSSILNSFIWATAKTSILNTININKVLLASKFKWRISSSSDISNYEFC